MSHASCLVAINPTELELAKGVVKTAVEWQMEPFNEEGEWFKDGSRWDWYVIGGRYDRKDLDGNIRRRDSINLAQMKKVKIKHSKQTWVGMEARELGPKMKNLLYGVEEGETFNDYLIRQHDNPETSIAHYAFLRNRHWHEAERNGWFGPAATECEIHANPLDVEAMIRRCKYKDPETGACCIVWNETWEVWREQFWKRFVEPLPLDTLLVTVDYHV